MRYKQISENEINKKKKRKILGFCKIAENAVEYNLIIGTLRTVSKRLRKSLAELKIRGRIENIKTVALLRSAKLL